MRIVANAGGLNPAGLAEQAARGRAGLGLVAADRATSTGDDLRRAPRSSASAGALTANAYLGALRHRRARCAAGADVVVTGRVTDASLVVGPGGRALRLDARRRTTSWPAPWSPATSSSAAPRPPAATSPASSTCPRDAAGRWASRSPRSPPTARSVITKHDGTGGAVTRRHGDRAADLRGAVDALPRPRRHHPPRHDRAQPTTGPTGCGSPASAARRRRSSSRSASTSSAASATRGVRAHRPRHRGEGRLGAGPARRRARRAASVTWSLGRAAAEPTPTPRRAPRCLLRCTVQDAVARAGRHAVHRPPPSSSRWRRTPASR